LIKEFPNKGWEKGLDKAVISKIRATDSVDRKPGNGRPHLMSTADKIDAVQDLLLSQEDRSRTHRSTRQISRNIRISQPTVIRIIHVDLNLKCLKKRHAQQLTNSNNDSRLDRCKKLFRKIFERKCRFPLVY